MRRAAVVLVLLVGCASERGQITDPSPPPSGPDELVLRMEYEGGLRPASDVVGAVPAVSVYADGRVVRPGPQIELYPPPALPNLTVAKLSGEGLDELLDAARRAGLDGPDRTDDGLRSRIADAATTVFTFVDGEGPHRTAVYALEMSGDAKLKAFRDKLDGLQASGETALRFDRMRVFVTQPSADTGVEPGRVDWPLATPLDGFGQPSAAGTRCGVVEGEDFVKLHAAAREATSITRWLSAGAEHGLVFRPLLPDESGCP